MGIPFYFASLIRNHPDITSVVKQRMNVDVLGIDFNCLIHRYLQDSEPIKSVLDALAHILEHTCSAKHVYIALDGLVPYGKIVQQRYRRMRIKTDEGIFDRNQISPDTPYMRDLEIGLRARFPLAYISPTQEPGEGEHKIFQEIKNLPSNLRNTICIYGLDADLILLSLFNHKLSPSHGMFLLRESGEFNDPKLSNAEFSTMSIWKLLLGLPIKIEQYLALSVLCFGNDFMPNLGIFSLREDGYIRALDYYEKSGKPDLNTADGRFTFLKYAASQETRVLTERVKTRHRPEERAIVGKDLHSISRKYSLHILDGVENIEPVVEAFWRTFHCTMHYFKTNEALDWNWVYPYSDAPLIQDIIQYYEMIPEHVPLTYKVVNQLQVIMPSKSLRTSKRRIMYPNELHSETRNPWMKRHDWEMKPRISIPWHPSYALTSVSLL